jgi:hypothetical protein
MGSVLASSVGRWTKATPGHARVEINAFNSGYQEFEQFRSAYSLIEYKYRLTFFYGITITLYKSLHALGTVAPATVAQATAVQQIHLKRP